MEYSIKPAWKKQRLMVAIGFYHHTPGNTRAKQCTAARPYSMLNAQTADSLCLKHLSEGFSLIVTFARDDFLCVVIPIMKAIAGYG